MPRPLDNNYPNNEGIVLPISAENRFQTAVRNVFGVGKNRIAGQMMTKPAPTPNTIDFTKKKTAKVVPRSPIQLAAVRD